MTLGWVGRALVATISVIGLLGAERIALTSRPRARPSPAPRRPTPPPPPPARRRSPTHSGFEVAPSLVSAPTVLYADPNMFSFTAEYSADRAGYDALVSDTWRSPQGHPETITLARAAGLPGKSCAEPTVADGSLYAAASVSATTTFFFGLDSANLEVPGAYALWRQVNDGPPEVLVRNVLPDTVPFLAYRYLVGPAASSDSLADVPVALLPITSADTTLGEIGVQSLRVVEMHFLITSAGAHGGHHLRRVNLVVTLPQATTHLERPTCSSFPNVASRPSAVRSSDPGRTEIG